MKTKILRGSTRVPLKNGALLSLTRINRPCCYPRRSKAVFTLYTLARLSADDTRSL
ncbi:MAG: hypothetical protein UHO61_00515 [Acutalibacteraceae bacterium]|nr:hypothetical protein [Acutalibacteraceae bacterium]